LRNRNNIDIQPGMVGIVTMHCHRPKCALPQIRTKQPESAE
jgi:hypothetical protein